MNEGFAVDAILSEGVPHANRAIAVVLDKPVVRGGPSDLRGSEHLSVSLAAGQIGPDKTHHTRLKTERNRILSVFSLFVSFCSPAQLACPSLALVCPPNGVYMSLCYAIEVRRCFDMLCIAWRRSTSLLTLALKLSASPMPAASWLHARDALRTLPRRK